MDYLYIDIKITPFSDDAADLLTAYLGDIGYDSFEQTDDMLKAYIPADCFDEDVLKVMLAEVPSFGSEFTYTVNALERKDWNEQWEQEHFDPVLEREFGIRLRPRMAFGSGSHETTHQITSLLMSMDFQNQRVLDMGTGTGVLAIAMAKRNAAEVVAIDIDEFSVENAKENMALNFADDTQNFAYDTQNIKILLGDASAIDGMFDTIVANIHKNIIKQDIATYVQHLSNNGTLIMSGFFDEDVAEMTQCAESHSLTLTNAMSENGWSVLVFKH